MTRVQVKQSSRNWLVLGSANGSTNLGDESMWLAAVDQLRAAVGPVEVVTDGPVDWIPPRDNVRVLSPLHLRLRRGRHLYNWSQHSPAVSLTERLISKPLRNTYALNRARDLTAMGKDPVAALWRDAIAHSDGVVFSGAGAINEDFAVHGVAAWSYIANCAAEMQVPTLFVGQGLGPLDKKTTRETAARFLNRASLLTVREERSKAIAIDIGIRRPPIVTADWALCNPPLPSERLSADEIRHRLIGSSEFIVFSIHRRHSTSRAALNRVSLICESVARLAAQDGLRSLFVSNMTSGGYSDDRVTARLVLKSWASEPSEQATVLTERLSPGQTRALLACARGLISTRYHPMVFAMGEGTPSVGIAYDEYYDQKLRGVSSIFGVYSNIFSPDRGTSALKVYEELSSQRPGNISSGVVEDAVAPFRDLVRSVSK